MDFGVASTCSDFLVFQQTRLISNKCNFEVSEQYMFVSSLLRVQGTYQLTPGLRDGFLNVTFNKLTLVAFIWSSIKAFKRVIHYQILKKIGH